MSISPTPAAGWRSSANPSAMLRERIVTGIVLAAACLAALFWLPALGWATLAGCILALAAWEWAAFARCRTARARTGYTVATVVAFLGAAWLLRLASGATGTIALLPVYGAAIAFWLIVAPLWIWRRPSGMPSALLLALGWIVLLPAVLALVHLRNFDPMVLLLFMALVWVADIAAYFVGRRFGRFKLAPVVSPGKTWEGLAGAMAAAAVYAVVWTTVYPQATPAVLRDIPWSTGAMLLFVEVLTVLSVVGDLFESAMKRQAGLKDSGALLPGHGGILDRIDALTPVLPAAALLILI
ncbi:MAG TPA: phosphatidate cytidylyltransferase [Burkholderiales bacterium]|nr:phosphatidate cytidylyltransferase [Burkholderiales bacterium]